MTAADIRAHYDEAKARADALDERLDSEQLALAVRRELEGERDSARNAATALWRCYSRVKNEAAHRDDANALFIVLSKAMAGIAETPAATLQAAGVGDLFDLLNGSLEKLDRMSASRQAAIAEAVAKVESLIASRATPPPRPRRDDAAAEAPAAA